MNQCQPRVFGATKNSVFSLDLCIEQIAECTASLLFFFNG